MIALLRKFKASILEKSERFCVFASIGVFSFVLFFWGWILSGSVLVALVHLVGGASILLLKPLIKKKALFKLCFLAVCGFIAGASYLLTQFVIVPLCSAIVILVAYISYHRKRSLKEWCLGAFIPFVIVFATELIQNNLSFMFRHLFLEKTMLRYGFLITMFLVPFVCFFFSRLFNSKKLGYYVSIGLFGLLGVTNGFVYSITQQPFILSDLKIATTAAGVLQTQQVSLGTWVRVAAGVLILGGLCFLIKRIYKSKTPFPGVYRYTFAAVALCFSMFLLHIAGCVLYETTLLYKGNVKHGFITHFYVNLNAGFKLPDDAAKYVIEDENEEGEHNPNVIIIMNEAFSDLGSQFDLSLSEDPLEYFHSLQREYPTGITYSSVRGNNTCSSEWEALSGSPTALTEKGAMVYQDNCKPMRSIVSLFNSRGYTTVGFHPYYASGYNRSSMYAALDFDQVYFLEDIPSDLDTVRTYVSDEANYEQLIHFYEENEKNSDAPFFCFNITMQNHGGYNNMNLNDVYLTDNDTPQYSTYFSVLNKSDEALKTLISYFESVDEDTVILFFGDHQPMIGDEFYEALYQKPLSDLSLEEIQKMYAVPYLIWANYDLDKDAAPEATSNCYLTNILFEVADIPKSTWLNMVDEYQEDYPVITTEAVVNSKGEFFTTNSYLSSLKSSVSDKLIEYQKYSYGILYGLE